MKIAVKFDISQIFKLLVIIWDTQVVYNQLKNVRLNRMLFFCQAIKADKTHILQQIIQMTKTNPQINHRTNYFNFDNTYIEPTNYLIAAWLI